jgi:hypothetical protein
MLRMMHRPPRPGEPEPEHGDREPIRTAGTVPGPAQFTGDTEVEP